LPGICPTWYWNAWPCRCSAWPRALLRLRFLQQGRIHLYVVYFLAAVLILLLLGRWGRSYD
jgi:hypothetical protein